MTVYVDDFRVPARVGRINARWSHLRRAWFQDKPRGAWHYDVTDSMRARALALGAVAVSWREFARVWTRPGREGRPAVDGLPADGRSVTLAGRLVDVVRRVNRAGATWAEAGLDVDGDQVVPVLVFPQTYARVAVLVCEDEAVTVTGRVDCRETGDPVVIVSGLTRGGA